MDEAPIPAPLRRLKTQAGDIATHGLALIEAWPVVEIAHEATSGATNEPPCEASGQPKEDPAPPLAGFRILVAEDGPDNVRLYLRQLGRAGADVRVAANGREAVALAQAAAVGVLILGEAVGPAHGVALGLALAGLLVATWPTR